MAEADPRLAKMVNVHDAKTHLSRLLDRVLAGEEIVIAKAGKPYARLIPFASDPTPRPPRKPGQYKHLLGKISAEAVLAPTFTDEELDEFEAKLNDI